MANREPPGSSGPIAVKVAIAEAAHSQGRFRSLRARRPRSRQRRSGTAFAVQNQPWHEGDVRARQPVAWRVAALTGGTLLRPPGHETTDRRAPRQGARAHAACPRCHRFLHHDGWHDQIPCHHREVASVDRTAAGHPTTSRSSSRERFSCCPRCAHPCLAMSYPYRPSSSGGIESRVAHHILDMRRAPESNRLAKAGGTAGESLSSCRWARGFVILWRPVTR